MSENEEGSSVTRVKRRNPGKLVWVAVVSLALTMTAVFAPPPALLIVACSVPVAATLFLVWRLRPRVGGGIVRREVVFRDDVIATWVGGRWRAYSMLQVTAVPDVVKGDAKRFFRMLYLEGVPFFYHVRQGPAPGWVVEGGRDAALKASGAWKTSIVIGVWGEGGLEEAVREARVRAEKAKAFFEASFPHHKVEVLRGGGLVDVLRECFP
ncbi:MAG: hypothetical protein QXN15_06880 [Candidatus Jordarchaeales archaeon]|nr:hypothetical protein [Candidatus Jordarchaeia archaeon]